MISMPLRFMRLNARVMCRSFVNLPGPSAPSTRSGGKRDGMSRGDRKKREMNRDEPAD